MSSIGHFGKLLFRPGTSSISSSSSTAGTRPSSRWLASSAQKRKLKQGKAKKSRSQREDILLEKTIQTKADDIREKGVNWRPIFFLGIFPIVMSGFVVLSRDDLRKEVEEKGLGRAIKDFSRWRAQRAKEAISKDEEPQQQRENNASKENMEGGTEAN
jgi:hypothetical protein